MVKIINCFYDGFYGKITKIPEEKDYQNQEETWLKSCGGEKYVYYPSLPDLYHVKIIGGKYNQLLVTFLQENNLEII